MAAEKWSNSRFKIAPGAGTDFEARLFLLEEGREKSVGDFSFAFDLQRPELIDWSVEGTPILEKGGEAFEEAHNILRIRKTWLKVWYDSGHILADRSIYMLRFRDQPFGSYVWVDFKGYNRVP